MGSYSRTGYMALKIEAEENTPLKPTVFIPFMSEDIVTEYGATPAMSISGNRTMNIRDVKTAIGPPSGTINILVEPTTFGWFLLGVYGALNSGQLMKVDLVSGDWAAADTVTGDSSAKTATLDFISTENDYFLVSSPSGVYTDGETLSNGSTGVATLTQHDATVFGHQVVAPNSSLPTFTLEFGYDNEAYRYFGVRFVGFDITQADNIITAEIAVTARSEFKHARVTAITTAAGGSQTITVDQTSGLVTSDSIKVFRPSLDAFVDLPSSGVKIHTIDTIPTETSFTVTVLDADIAVGDLVMLSPQTPSYTVDNEFSWIGGSVVRIANTITPAVKSRGEQILDETDFATHAKWDATGDGDDTGGNFTYTHSTGSGSLTQTLANQATAGTGNAKYELSYTVSGVTGDGAGTLTTAWAATALTLTLTAGTHTLTFDSATSTVDFVLSFTSGSGGFTIDDISLKQVTGGDSIENFDMVLTNDIEPRHGANGINVIDRFPTKNFLKGLTGTVTLDRTYDDMTYLDILRKSRSQGISIEHTGGQIGSTGQNFGLDWRIAKGIMQAMNPSFSEDDLLNQAMIFDMYDSSAEGWTAKALLINDTSSYT